MKIQQVLKAPCTAIAVLCAGCTGTGLDMSDQFKRIGIGDTQADVVAQMGAPLSRNTTEAIGLTIAEFDYMDVSRRYGVVMVSTPLTGARVILKRQQPIVCK